MLGVYSHSLDVREQGPDPVDVVAQDVLLRRRKMLTASALKVLDVVLGHVDEQAQVSRVAPETNLGELVKDEFPGFQLFRLARVGFVVERLGETGGQLKDGSA